MLSSSKTVYRGHLYKSEKGEWILSSDPHLKTCCVGKASKRESQIFLDNQFPEEMNGKRAWLKGELTWDGETRVLKGATLAQQTPFPSYSIAFALLIGTLFLLRRLLKPRRAPLP